MPKKAHKHLIEYFTFKNILLNVCIALLYVASGKLGLSLAFINSSTSAIWPPTGIALAAFLLFGNRVIPAIFLGAFIVNLTTAGTIATSLGIATGNTFEGVVGAYLVKKFANGVHAFDNVANIFKFCFAVMISTTISANIGVVTLMLGNLANWQEFAPIWITWWLGDLGGAIVIAPVFLAWKNTPWIHYGYKNLLNLSVSILGLFIITSIVFTGVIPYPYLCIPIGVWIAFWFGRKGATIATILVAGMAIYYTLHGQGPFANMSTLNKSLLLLQLFLGTFSITTLTFAATVFGIKRSERELASQEKRSQALIENSSDGVVLIDPTSKISYASPSVKKIMGYEPEELIGTIGFDLVAPEDRPYTIRKLAQLALKPGGTLIVEYQIIRKNGERRWVQATGTNLLLEPNVNAVVVNFHDITENKIAQESLIEEKIIDEAMLSNIGEGIMATDDEGRITMINDAACEMLGWKEKELMNKFLTEIIPMEDESGKVLPVKERPMTKVLSLGRKLVTSQTNYYITKDKTKLPIRFTLTPIVIKGITVGTIEVFRDITKEREIDKAKTEFVSLASHQLRTPLTIINWSMEALMKKSEITDPKQKHYLEEIYHASQRMVELINSLLNVSRLELGTFIIEPQKTDILAIARQVVGYLKPQIQKRSITIQTKFPATMPQVMADPKLITIVIQNFVSNAVKYSKDNSKVMLEISLHDKQIIIHVQDKGHGIPKNQQSKIFTKLFRADNARVLDPDGTGLGLYIVKTVIDSAGGKVWFTSEENKGTSFFVSFPVTGMQKKEGQKLLR
jgi:PAS domain S-box-containing protein